MFLDKKNQKIDIIIKDSSRKKLFEDDSISAIVEEKARALQHKYNLSSENIEKIKNTLYCICENIITNYIRKCVERSLKK
jgi:S-adenosylmethionine:tRNA-ribosyltransferase-isomerase (queuine synthetase)